MNINNDKSNSEQAGDFAAQIGSVIADRNGTHGDPIDNHNHIAGLWTAYLGDALDRPIVGDEVADMMILLKLSRKHVGGMDIDHYRDAIGYAAIGSLYVPDDSEKDDVEDVETFDIAERYPEYPDAEFEERVLAWADDLTESGVLFMEDLIDEFPREDEQDWASEALEDSGVWEWDQDSHAFIRE